MNDKDNNFINILAKLTEISKRLENIERDIMYLKKGHENMNEHISFIENVYDTIKSPFYFIINKIKPIDKIPEKPKNLIQ